MKKVRHISEYIILISMQKFAGLWSLQWNQRFGKWFGNLAYLLARKDRGVADYQMGFCFPELSHNERDQLVRKTFQSTGKTLFETLIVQRIRKTPGKYIRLENEEVVHHALQAGHGLVMLFGHVGNWELLPTIYEMLNIKGIAVESPVGDNKLDDLLLSVRKSDNILMVPRGDRSSARSILNCFRNNKVFLFAMDQDTRVKSVFVDFFNHKASTAKGAATFAQKFSAPVVSAFGARLPDGSHLYTFELLSQSPYRCDEREEWELTQHYTAQLEKHIRAYPDQWVWFHRRWKIQPDDPDS
ncbi:MAG: hypothetical protein ABIK68_20845 [bacterium]